MYITNYPNERDRAAGRTGEGIWIHGTEEDSVPINTRGCLELSNTNLYELSGYLGIGIGVPVIMVNDSSGTSPLMSIDFNDVADQRKKAISLYNNNLRTFVGLVSQWKTAWESRNIEEYERMYATGLFYGQGFSFLSIIYIFLLFSAAN